VVTRDAGATAPTRDVDEITLAVVQGMLESTTREMTVTMANTCRSPILKLAHDFSNAVFDWVPQMVIQGEDIPNHLGALMYSCRDVAAYFGDDIRPGDVMYHNDPSTGNSHLQDMCVYRPVFYEDELQFWVVNKAHMTDTGGPVPGGYNPTAREIYAEGIRIPPVRIVDAGKMRNDVVDMILANVRTPDWHRGDLLAQLGTLGVAERRLVGMMDKIGRQATRDCVAEILDRSEAWMRREIEKLPDGVYDGEAPVEDDGVTGPSTIRCRVTISGDEMSLEYSSRPQGPSYINAYEPITSSMAYLGVLFFVDPDMPHNAGIYRPIKFDPGPRGSLTNAVHPAPCSCSTSTVGENITEAVVSALNAAVPDKAAAGWGHITALIVSGVDPRSDDYYIYFGFNTLIGGAGAFAGMDGWNSLGATASSGSLYTDDVEMVEYEYPIFVHRFELRTDSASPGRWRGGFGPRYDFELVGHEGTVTRWGEGEFPAVSVLGAGAELPGRGGTYFIRHADGSRTPIGRHSVELPVREGDVLECHIIGGGGVGPARERDPELVAADVRAGLVSRESAEREYGVVLLDGGEIDADATAELRARMASEGSS
jgi:N-methylhydantoinase B